MTSRDDALDRLPRMLAERDDLDATITAYVRYLRSLGITWKEIGRSVHRSKQAAQQRWGG